MGEPSKSKLVNSPLGAAITCALLHGLLFAATLLFWRMELVEKYIARTQAMELKLPSVTNNVLSVWLRITDPLWLFLLILCLVIIAHGSVLYVLDRSEIWRMAREVWSGMILSLLIGFFIYSAACMVPPYQYLLSSIMGENVDRQEFQRLEGEWISVPSWMEQQRRSSHLRLIFCDSSESKSAAIAGPVSITGLAGIRLEESLKVL